MAGRGGGESRSVQRRGADQPCAALPVVDEEAELVPHVHPAGELFLRGLCPWCKVGPPAQDAKLILNLKARKEENETEEV